MDNDIFSRKQTADFLDISDATLRNWNKAGILSPDHRGKYRRVHVEKLLEKIEKGEILRLRSRANKKGLSKRFAPDELSGPDNIHTRWLDRIKKTGIDSSGIPIAAVYIYIRKNTPLDIHFSSSVTEFDIPAYPLLSRELNKMREQFLWDFDDLSLLNRIELTGDPPDKDWFGFCYQSLIGEGEKNKKGSYFTPYRTAYKAVVDSSPEDSGIWLDPCCGAGAFVSAMAAFRKTPENIRAFDIDPLAVSFARIQLQCDFWENDFIPDIHQANYLDSAVGEYSFIATNPPWGVKYSREEKKELTALFPETYGFESFALFLKKSISQLVSGGQLFYLLPKSVLNTIRFSRLRKDILESGDIVRIGFYSRHFQKVYTPSLGLFFNKKERESSFALNRYFEKNPYFIFNHGLEIGERDLLMKLFSFKSFSLKNNCRWGMGIVTGDNKKLTMKSELPGMEALYTGRQLQAFHLDDAKLWFKFDKKRFQQAAPEELYRSPKIMYRFIQDRLSCYSDTQGFFCLNSINFMIPLTSEYSNNAVCGLLNSSVMNFIYRRLFFSNKILRSHLEELPLFLIPVDKREEWERLCIACTGLPRELKKLDQFLYDFLHLKDSEIRLIESAVYPQSKSAILSSSSSY